MPDPETGLLLPAGRRNVGGSRRKAKNFGKASGFSAVGGFGAFLINKILTGKKPNNVYYLANTLLELPKV